MPAAADPYQLDKPKPRPRLSKARQAPAQSPPPVLMRSRKSLASAMPTTTSQNQRAMAAAATNAAAALTPSLEVARKRAAVKSAAKPAAISTIRNRLAKTSFEIGKANHSSVGNTSNLDTSTSNRNDEGEGGSDPMKLSPFYDGYPTRNLLEKWRDLPPRLIMSDWAFYIKTTRRRSQRSQVDHLVGDICSKVLNMRELMHYSLDSGAHCLLWLNSSMAQKYIFGMRKGTHIIGRVMCDVMLKDKQNLSNFLVEHQFKEWIECAPHICMNEKKEEIKRNLQRICRHQYNGHYMGKCIEETPGTECPNFDYYFCECFRRHFFIPEFYTFSHYYLMEEFLKKYETDEEFMKTVWLAKPSYLTSGKGFFLIRDAREFRYFYLVRSDNCVRREGFVLQRYLTRPCTVNSCKIDCRMYLMITVTNGRRVSGFFHPGFTRTAAAPWTTKFKEKISGHIMEHVTATELYKLANVKMSGDSEEEDDDKNNQCLPFNETCEKIKTQVNVKKGEVEKPMPFDNEGGNLQENDFDKFHWRFKYIVDVLCSKLDPMVRDKCGTFQIFGLDILIDSDAKPWLLEVNSHVATEQEFDTSQCRIISNVVTEGICIMCEMLQKSLMEEVIAIEIQQGDQKLSKLTRAQRMMTARAEQEALDRMQVVLQKTEISKRCPPVFLQNFFWWYDTPQYRWLKPWVLHKRKPKVEVPWYSQVFLSMASRNHAIRRKNLKTAPHDAMDYYRHIFWREKLESDIRRFEIEKLAKRADMVAGSGASANGAGFSVPGGGGSVKDPSLKDVLQPSVDQEPKSASNVAGSFYFADDNRNLDDDEYDDGNDGDLEVNLRNFEEDEAAMLCLKADAGQDVGIVGQKLDGRQQHLPTAEEVLNSAQRDSSNSTRARPTKRFRARFADRPGLR